jgi:dTDP-glucose 4,6-dehydratase
LNEYSIDAIIHFAAQSHVDNSFDNSLQYTTDNVMGTHVLLQASKEYGKIKKFLHFSTDEVYGEVDLEHPGCHEKSLLNPTNPYAATKAAAEFLVRSYYHSFKLPVVIVRCNNVYGPNQYPEKLIPLFIKQLKNNEQVTIQGDGSNVRAFIHVADVVKAFDIILEKGRIGEIYNIGSDDNEEYTVKYVAEMLIKKIKKTDNYGEHIEYIIDRPFNDKRYYISNEKIKKLGWDITEKFEEGIDNLIQMYNAK